MGNAWAFEDVAPYLKVTETTVISWVEKRILLAMVINLLKNKNVREAALDCSDARSAYRIITGEF